MQQPKIIKNAVTCTICGSPADKYQFHYQYQKNKNHIGDLVVGIFTDMSIKAKK